MRNLLPKTPENHQKNERTNQSTLTSAPLLPNLGLTSSPSPDAQVVAGTRTGRNTRPSLGPAIPTPADRLHFGWASRGSNWVSHSLFQRLTKHDSAIANSETPHQVGHMHMNIRTSIYYIYISLKVMSIFNILVPI